jgi:hypothetical protein
MDGKSKNIPGYVQERYKYKGCGFNGAKLNKDERNTYQ